ncbi:hypothetical protein AB0945_19700 [Streptomyces sp. NPDC005474]|uniref:hypothetical protein n=1 Tax=Streptomyces sp. NPDC005474 TaxID=3154878 RepID=UPI00345484B2
MILPSSPLVRGPSPLPTGRQPSWTRGQTADHYTPEAQTLTTGAEANLLKPAELRGTLTREQAARWAELQAAYVRTRTHGGPDDDLLTRAVTTLGLLADRLAAVETAITAGADITRI